MPLQNILNEAPSSTQPKCHSQDLKEGSIGREVPGIKSPSNLVPEEMSRACGIHSGSRTCPWHMPHLWKCSRQGLEQPGLMEGVPVHDRDWNKMNCHVCSHANHSVIPWFLLRWHLGRI